MFGFRVGYAGLVMLRSFLFVGSFFILKIVRIIQYFGRGHSFAGLPGSIFVSPSNFSHEVRLSALGVFSILLLFPSRYASVCQSLMLSICLSVYYSVYLLLSLNV